MQVIEVLVLLLGVLVPCCWGRLAVGRAPQETEGGAAMFAFCSGMFSSSSMCGNGWRIARCPRSRHSRVVKVSESRALGQISS